MPGVNPDAREEQCPKSKGINESHGITLFDGGQPVALPSAPGMQQTSGEICTIGENLPGVRHLSLAS